MAIIVTPGPLPSDGTRLDVDVVLAAYVNGTTIRNFGPAEFQGSRDINFVISQTDAPATSTRGPGMLWFKRGEGVLYFWDAQNASESIAQWVAISNRKEVVVHLQSGPAADGSLVWLDTGAGQGQFTEFYGKQVDANRMVIKVQATESSAPFVPLRQIPVPPFFVIPDAVPLTFAVTSFSGVGAGVYTKAVELGYTRSRVFGLDSTEGPGHGILQASNMVDGFYLSLDPLGFSNCWAAHVVGSGPPDDNQQLMVFIKGTPANLAV